MFLSLKDHIPFEQLKKGAVIGTSSLRRSAQLLAVRPDLEIKWIRGNIDTRLGKLETGEYDAIILAAAGLYRLGWASDVITEFIDENVCVPAVGQGALSIECREDDKELHDLFEKFTCKNTERAVRAERAFLQKMEGGCQVPIAGYAYINDQDEVVLTGLVGSPDGNIIYKEQLTGQNSEEIGMLVAERLIEKGAKALIDQVKQELDKE